MVKILMMSSKMVSLGLPKIKEFFKKVYGIIISIYDVFNKNLSHGSNYIVDVVI